MDIKPVNILMSERLVKDFDELYKSDNFNDDCK